MQTSTSLRRKSFKLYAMLFGAVLALGAAATTLVSVGPVQAASLAHDADTQIAVFMVPLTLLVLAILFEAARIALRGPLPEQHRPRRARAHWQPGRGEG